ncbi:YceI family protein [Aquiflexum gelatinilyticum]|uniref:YceI family protein n=1 Tax=Aquiflexum gelatinilyticum TaxID=2961943 RepID=UPI002166D493|nr:YceI family protein [Aquiflexum gelatinilyticum]MCS4433046.1 YceI family protein [Aquiflexum gelatinilyticum]
MKRFWFYFIAISFFAFPKIGNTQGFKTESGSVEFLSKASLNEFTGVSSSLNGLMDLDKNLLDFFVDLNTLKTGIGLRDRHMRENYLETKKFPFAEFTGKIETLPTLIKGQSREVLAKGKFKIHGVEREIEVPGKLTMISDNELKLEAQFKVLLSDYKIDIPTVVFYELSEEQVVTIQAVLKKN